MLTIEGARWPVLSIRNGDPSSIGLIYGLVKARPPKYTAKQVPTGASTTVALVGSSNFAMFVVDANSLPRGGSVPLLDGYACRTCWH